MLMEESVCIRKTVSLFVHHRLKEEGRERETKGERGKGKEEEKEKERDK